MRLNFERNCGASLIALPRNSIAYEDRRQVPKVWEAYRLDRKAQKRRILVPIRCS